MLKNKKTANAAVVAFISIVLAIVAKMNVFQIVQQTLKVVIMVIVLENKVQGLSHILACPCNKDCPDGCEFCENQACSCSVSYNRLQSDIF